MSVNSIGHLLVGIYQVSPRPGGPSVPHINPGLVLANSPHDHHSPRYPQWHGCNNNTQKIANDLLTLINSNSKSQHYHYPLSTLSPLLIKFIYKPTRIYTLVWILILFICILQEIFHVFRGYKKPGCYQGRKLSTYPLKKLWGIKFITLKVV